MLKRVGAMTRSTMPRMWLTAQSAYPTKATGQPTVM